MLVLIVVDAVPAGKQRKSNFSTPLDKPCGEDLATLGIFN